MEKPFFGGVIAPPWNDIDIERMVDEAIATGNTNIKPSRFKIGPYNGHSPESRLIADRKIKVAIEQGLIPPPKVCSICGTQEGRIDYHNEDYSRPLQTVAICMKCHMALHNRFRSPGYSASWERLVKTYGNGTSWFERI